MVRAVPSFGFMGLLPLLVDHHHAALKGHTTLIETLIANGAKTSMKDFEGLTPRDIAKRYQNDAVAKQLITRDSGA